MKKLLVLLTIFLLVGISRAQTYVFQSLDHSVADSLWDMQHLYDDPGDMKATPHLDYTDNTTDQKEGAGCMKLDYAFGAGDSWGGYIVRTSVKPLPNNLVYDISTGTQISFWYRVAVPATLSGGGGLNMDFKLCDISETGENRISHTYPIDATDASGQWHQVTIDMNISGDKTVDFAYESTDGDREFDWSHINGNEIAMVYFPSTSPAGPTNTPTASGVIEIDGYSVTGDHYAPPFLSFVNMASGFGIDDMGWAGDAGKGAVSLKDVSDDKVEGTDGSLEFDYTCNASQGWGGFVAFDKTITPPKDPLERTALTIFIKNKVPCVTTVPKRAVMRIFLFEDDGEQWITKVPIDLTTASGWIRYRLPLKQVAYSSNGDQYPPVGAFGLNPNGGKGDQTFNFDKINKIRIEVLAVGVGPDAGPQGEKLTGTLLFGVMQNSGFQIYDITPPAAPASFMATKGTYSNLLSWKDVDNEGTEKYYVYASRAPITDIKAPGVELVGNGIARGVQVFEHLIRAPKNDKDVTYYYSINAIDKNGNIGAFSTTGGVTNTAKGIPTIYHGTIDFKADGDLNEWKLANVAPFKLRLSDGSEHVMNGFTTTSDADLSADVYVALDNNYLYTAFDVTDDIVYADDDKYMSSGTSWALDAAELQFGLYNQERTQHTKYKRGSHPDYHLRFNKVRAREDWENVDSLLLPGADYYWQEKFPTGYVVEVRMSLSKLANLTASKDTINLMEGYKIPFDIVIPDNDGGTDPQLYKNRRGQISWSPFNNDDGWRDPTKWMYTWLGDKEFPTDVKQDKLPFEFTLSQNYPNPFNPTTQIKYSIAKAGVVNLKVYDVLGRLLGELVNQVQNPGQYTVNFDASRLSSGVYFYRLESGSFVSVKKMLLLK